jgi:hypothetical protein
MATRAQQFDFLLAGVNDPDIPGAPLALGTVKFFEVGTSTAKDVWTESAKTNDYTEYTLDANGVAELYGDGSYKIELYDSGGSLEYTFDEVKCTASTYNRRVVSTSPITVTPDDDIIFINTGSGNITLNLQDVALFSKPVTLKKISASNTATYDAYSTQTIDGDLTGTLTANNDTVTLVPDTDSGQWRKTNHLATGLVGLTATVAELNQLDGNVLSRDGSTTIMDIGGTTSESPLIVLVPNLDDVGVALAYIGFAQSNYNSLQFTFYKESDGSQNNEMQFGLYGVGSAFRINGYQNVGIGGAPAGSGSYRFRAVGTSEITDTLTLSKASGTGLSVTSDIDFNAIASGATKAEINLTCDGNTATAAEIASVCDGNTATAAEIVKAADGIGVSIPRAAIFNIGDWNMDTTSELTVATGISEDKILAAKAMIRPDSPVTGVNYPLDSTGVAGGTVTMQGGVEYWNSSGVVLNRLTGGFFDGTTFDATSYNRGYVIVWYID